MPQLTQFTAAEAAFVLRVPIRDVKKALDSGPVQPTLRAQSGSYIRVIDRTDLFYLFAIKTLRDSLTQPAREEFFRALKRTRGRADEIRFGRFRVAVADLVDELSKRNADLSALLATVALAADGTPVLRPRGIALHRIAALLNGGLSANAVREEFPSLTRKSIETARAFAQVRPKRGRRYPDTTANRLQRRDDAREEGDGEDGGQA